VDEAARGELAVEDDVQWQVQQHAEDPAPEPSNLRNPCDTGQQDQQLVRVQEKDDPLRLAADVVSEKARRAQVALALEEHVVDHVVDVDQEATGGQARDEGRVARARVDGRARCGGGDEVPAWTHGAISASRGRGGGAPGLEQAG
jgi:hypothetical protein